MDTVYENRVWKGAKGDVVYTLAENVVVLPNR